MDVLTRLADAVPALVVGAVVLFYLRGRFEEQREEMNRRFDEMKEDTNRRFEQVDRRFDRVDRRFEQVERRLEGLEQAIAAVRSDITQLAIAFGTRLRPETGTG